MQRIKILISNMNKKANPTDILSKRTTIRYKAAEYLLVKQRAEAAGMSFADFCRQITLKGYVQAVPTTHDLNTLRELKTILIEYRTHFSRISNFIKYADPALSAEIIQLKNAIQNLIDNIRL
jgi:hypothetical protein